MLLPGDTVIRPMRPADVDRAVAIAASLATAPHWPAESYRAALDPASRPERIALVAQSKDDIVGFAIVSVIGPQAELESIAVPAELQGQGIGAALLQAVAEAALHAGAEAMLLEVRASNRPAVRLYTRRGFTEAGRRRSYYTDPVEDAVILRLALRP